MFIIIFYSLIININNKELIIITTSLEIRNKQILFRKKLFLKISWKGEFINCKNQRGRKKFRWGKI